MLWHHFYINNRSLVWAISYETIIIILLLKATFLDSGYVTKLPQHGRTLTDKFNKLKILVSIRMVSNQYSADLYFVKIIFYNAMDRFHNARQLRARTRLRT